LKGTVKIISGNMRGRIIPFDNKKFSDADITPQKVKGALFSILGEELHGRVFVDLFSGSGQMGLEALSRWCERAVFVEKDPHRFRFIRKTVENTGNSSRAILYNTDYVSALNKISGSGIRADIIFADPPYVKSSAENREYGIILEKIYESGILNESGVAAIQHFTENTLPESAAGFTRKSLKKYGTTSVSFYRL
jgi:16S rRNA (guanine(966)-N(2))-methyltransferase RsmD